MTKKLKVRRICGFPKITECSESDTPIVTYCTGLAVKHPYYYDVWFCRSKKCERYYRCVSCGKKIGEHLDHSSFDSKKPFIDT